MGTGDYAFRRNSAARTFGKTVFPPEEDLKIGKTTTAAAQEGARGGREVVTDACATSSECRKCLVIVDFFLKSGDYIIPTMTA